MTKYDFHDYEISWDYEIDENVSKEYIHLIKDICQEIKENLLPKLNVFKDFEVTPIILDKGTVAVYCFGTEEFPVIGIDIQSHIDGLAEVDDDIETGIRMSILHELGHAIQQYKGKEFNEREAEDFAFDYDFHGVINKI